MFTAVIPHLTLWRGKKKFLLLGFLTNEAEADEKPKPLIANFLNGKLEIVELDDVRLNLEDVVDVEEGLEELEGEGEGEGDEWKGGS